MNENKEKQTNSKTKPNLKTKSNAEKKTKTTQSIYQVVSKQTEDKKAKVHISFSKSVLLPFTCGVMGSILVLGTCLGVPTIREKLVGTAPTSNSSIPTTSRTTDTANTNFISLANYSETATGVASKVLPSIVGIKVEYAVSSIFGRSTSSAEGSGIIISDDGYILTNNHIVDDASNSSHYSAVSEANKIMVYLYNDETGYEASIVGTDSQTDLAVIKIEKTGLTKATLGNSDEVQVGEFAMAVGNPLGMQSSVTSGIVSAMNRKVTDTDGKTYNLIQTDAAINAGNSGGALVNSKGEVIGINTLKLSGSGVEGMGFAIPINATVDISQQLIQYSKVKRPYVGLGGITVDEKTAQSNHLTVGIYVKTVEDFSAAEKAGIRVGDVITEVDGQKVTSVSQMNDIKNKHQIGDTLTFKIWRDGKESTVSVVLQEQ